MNNLSITKVLENDIDTKSSFKGVFASDTCPRTLQRGRCYVINTDPVTFPGRHWVCVYVPQGKGSVEYFDSYGRPPTTVPGIANVLRNRNVIHNTKQIQSLYSDVCGHYCIYFLKQRCVGRSMHHIVNKFTDDPRRNDKYVERLIRPLFVK